MNGLLLKDFYMAFEYCRAFLLMVSVFIAVSFFGDDNIFFIIYPTLISGILPMTLISYDERDKWTQYSGTLPYSKSQIVSSKYITGLCLGGFSFILTMLASVVRMNINGVFSLSKLLFIGILLFILGLLGPSLLFPFVFKYGTEKGRIAYYLIIGVLWAGVMMFMSIGFVNSDTPIMNIGSKLVFINTVSISIALIICAVVIALYLMSWYLSILFYRRREL